MHAPIPQRRRSVLVIVLAMLAALAVALPGLASHDGGLSGLFEATDGNLHPDGAEKIDWNSFSDGPNQINAVGEAWNFTPAVDDTGNKDGSIYTKNTKDHRFECPNIGSGSMGGGGNKDDLKRLYLANQEIDGKEYLLLAWTRVPQNSTSASANLSFEFNRGTAGTCDNSDLLKRVPGDMLVLYDFLGGENRVEIFLSRWTATGPCEVSNHSVPCWGPVADLTADGHAAGKVNTTDVTSGLNDTWAGETLTTVAFGEAVINLTDAGVFGEDSCDGFGWAAGISRSSGNSISSSLSDLLGPVKFDLAPCASLLVEKVDNSGNPLSGAAFTLAEVVGEDADENPIFGPPVTMTPYANGTLFCLDGLSAGEYRLLETTTPTGYTSAFDDIVTVAPGASCDDRTAPEEGDPIADVTVENVPRPGKIEILKVDDAGNELAGVRFDLFLEDPDNAGSTTGNSLDHCITDIDGECTIDNVDPGNYCVVEDTTTVPTDYQGDVTPDCFEVEVVTDSDDGDLVELTFTNPRLHKAIVIVCHMGTDTLAASDVTLGTDELTTLAEGAVSAELEAILCGLAGFDGLEHDEYDLTVDVGSDAHTP